MHFFDPITDFIFIEHEVEAADVIFIPGGPCGEIALHAAELYHQGYAPLLIPSGKHSILDPVYRGAQSPEKYRGREFPTEADFFSTILLDQEATENLRSAIEKNLSPFECRVLDLYLSGLDYLQIAEELERPAKSKDNALQRIRAKVNRTLEY